MVAIEKSFFTKRLTICAHFTTRLCYYFFINRQAKYAAGIKGQKKAPIITDCENKSA